MGSTHAGTYNPLLLPFSACFDGNLTSQPVIPGHEIAGTAVRVGSKVKDVKVGDRVGVGYVLRVLLRILLAPLIRDS